MLVMSRSAHTLRSMAALVAAAVERRAATTARTVVLVVVVVSGGPAATIRTSVRDGRVCRNQPLARRTVLASSHPTGSLGGPRPTRGIVRAGDPMRGKERERQLG